ncbi:dTMP kinase [Thermodesulfobacteriota bacterium]
MKTFFVAFEGIDGSGKTVLSNLIADWFRQSGLSVHHAREKGEYASGVARAIRKLARDPVNLEMGPRTELLLYLARDVQSMEETIIPYMGEVDVIIADRFLSSHLSLAHFGRGIERESADRTISSVSSGLEPHLTVYIDVDTLTARIRKRIQKIKKRRLGDFGRRGLSGISLREKMREGFLLLSGENPGEWLVVDNTAAPVERVGIEVWEHIRRRMSFLGHPNAELLTSKESSPDEPKPVILPPEALSGDEEKYTSSLFDEIDRIASSDTTLAAFYLNGLEHSRAYDIRCKVLTKEKELVAWGLEALTSEQSLDFRQDMAAAEPQYVAYSLNRTPCEGEWARLRERLIPESPVEVGRSLRFLDSNDSWSIRERLLEVSPEGALISLAGLDVDRAWAVRNALRKKKHHKYLAMSVKGVDSDEAWRIRDEVADRALPWVILSLRGCSSERAWSMRERYADKAPKLVAKSLLFLEDDRAWALRERIKESAKEVLDSIVQMDSPAAWTLREGLAGRWPNTAVSSVGSLLDTSRAWEFRWDMVRRHPGNLLLAKHVQRAIEATGKVKWNSE